jgi:hypothetical protein
LKNFRRVAAGRNILRRIIRNEVARLTRTSRRR